MSKNMSGRKYLLFVILAGTLMSGWAGSHGKKVVGYFINWGVYGRDYLVKDVPADKLTHLNFAFVAPFILEGEYELFGSIDTNLFKKSDGSHPSQPMYIVGVSHCTISNTVYSVGLAVDDQWACFQNAAYARRYHAEPAYGWRDNVYSSWDKPGAGGASGPKDRTAGIFGELLGMKAAFPHIKILTSIGGWSYSYYFPAIADHDASRQAFAIASKQMLDLFAARDSLPDLFDGLDLDWEFPYTGGDSAIEHRLNDKTNLTALCKAIREQIGSEKLLTIATAQNYQNIQHQYESALEEYLDFLSIMAYDYSGAWSPRTGMNAPLFGGNTNDPLYNPADGKYLVISEVVAAFLQQGFQPSKLLLGLPFYGRTFGEVANADNGLYQTFNGAGFGSFETGQVEFNDIVDGLRGNQILTRTGDEWSGANGYVRYWDDLSKTPFLFNGSCFVSYDDDVSLAAKVSLAKERKLGGVMIWELSSDTRADSGSPNLLMNAVDAALHYSPSISPGDYNGDGKSDFTVFCRETGKWFTLSADQQAVLIWDMPFGTPGSMPVPGDYNGDGTSDFAIFCLETCMWYVLGSDRQTVLAWNMPFGVASSIPVPGDYNGDGKSDFGVFCQQTGAWYVLDSDQQTVLAWDMPFGPPGSTPVPGDYSGDGKSDFAVFCRQTSRWYVLDSDQQTVLAWDMSFGTPSSIPVPGDYNGDGKSDFAVFCQQTGRWYVLDSNQGTVLAWGVAFGWPGALPVGSGL